MMKTIKPLDHHEVQETLRLLATELNARRMTELSEDPAVVAAGIEYSALRSMATGRVKSLSYHAVKTLLPVLRRRAGIAAVDHQQEEHTHE